MTAERIRALVVALVFIACVAVVLIGQQTVGWPSLFLMLLGLAGLITLLALYNRKYR